MINLSQQLKLGLKLTPQQVQYLKLLQLPTLALEQRIKTELEVNPLLETLDEMEQTEEQEEPETPKAEDDGAEDKIEDSYTLDDYLNDDLAGYKSPEAYRNNDQEEEYERPLVATIPLSERLLSQLKLRAADEMDFLLAEEILGNVDE
ncbi:MAG: RNA polymerase sigma-54 factor, partial [Bacteroidota bacterium]